jgi:hypothetical protein
LTTVRDENGAIKNKIVGFKNYSGDENYASFRYEVNIKNI